MRFFFLLVVSAISPLFLFIPTQLSAAEQRPVYKNGYLVVEGNVTSLKTRMIVVNGQQYPVSAYVRVFSGRLSGTEMKWQDCVYGGGITYAKIYLLGGKVEKIVVLKSL